MYRDLKIVLEDANFSDLDLNQIRSEALQIAYECNQRSLGEDCVERCPVPRVALATDDKILSALTQVADNGFQLQG